MHWERWRKGLHTQLIHERKKEDNYLLHLLSMDSILLRCIRVVTRIGVPNDERKKPQEVLVTLELFQSLKNIAQTDSVTDGIDYAKVTEEVLMLGKTERKTIERFAENIASVLLKKFKPEGGVCITVTKKPDLPLESASVTITRP